MPKAKKVKTKPQDGGLDANTRQRLRTAIRQVWAWTSYARKLCLKRALIKDGFSRCEGCRRIAAKVYADHIDPCGKLDSGFIDRLFVSSDRLQALCEKCHRLKTNEEKALIKMGIC